MILESTSSVNKTKDNNVILNPTWDPPIVSFNKNLNTTYTFLDTTYLWNGKIWVIEDSILKQKIDKDPYFGYDVFKTDPKIFQNLDLTNVDPNHIIGPGDEIIIMLWGQVEINVPYVVSKEGYIFVDNLGQVFVNGLTLEKLDKKLFKLLKKVYSSLDNSSTPASTFLDISLGSTLNRPLRVFVVGEVRNQVLLIYPIQLLYTHRFIFLEVQLKKVVLETFA